MAQIPKIDLRFWQEGGELAVLAGVFEVWWNKLVTALEWIRLQYDAETADVAMLDLLAYQRDIERLPDEPEALYRKRVKYALANAKDAGCVAGFARIWERLGLGFVGQSERVDPVDWDVIQLEITEQTLAQPELLPTIIRMYGRTCRRYELSTITPLAVRVRIADFEHTTLSALAAANETNAVAAIRTFDISNDTENIKAGA